MVPIVADLFGDLLADLVANLIADLDAVLDLDLVADHGGDHGAVPPRVGGPVSPNVGLEADLGLELTFFGDVEHGVSIGIA